MSKKQNLIGRYEHELILTLLLILVVSVISLFILIKEQNTQIMDTQELLHQIADEAFADLD